MNRKVFWILLAALHAVFFCKQIFFGNAMIQDSKEYLYAADNLINKGTLYAWNLNHGFSTDWLTRRPFLYPSILVVFKFLSFGNSQAFFVIAYFAQNLMSLFNLWLCVRICEKNGIRPSWPRLFLFLIFCVSQFIYANMIMSEIWLQGTLLGILYFTLNDKSRYANLWCSLLLIAAMALKPVMMLFAFVFPLMVAFRKRKSLRLNHLLFLLPLVYYFSVCEINKERTGYFHYSSISTFNLLHYNTYVMLMSEYGAPKADSIIDGIRARAEHQGSYAGSQVYIGGECKKLIGEYWVRYSYLHLRGIGFALFDPGRFDLTQFFRLPHGFNLVYRLNQGSLLQTVVNTFFNPLGIALMALILFNTFRNFKAVVFVFNKQWPLEFRILVILIPAYVLTMTGPIGSSRFFMPLVPFAIITYLLSSNRPVNDKEQK